jgi:hypothetical protein
MNVLMLIEQPGRYLWWPTAAICSHVSLGMYVSFYRQLQYVLTSNVQMPKVACTGLWTIEGSVHGCIYTTLHVQTGLCLNIIQGLFTDMGFWCSPPSMTLLKIHLVHVLRLWHFASSRGL